MILSVVIIATNGITLNVLNLGEPNLTFFAKTNPSHGHAGNVLKIVVKNVKLSPGMVVKLFVTCATIPTILNVQALVKTPYYLVLVKIVSGIVIHVTKIFFPLII